MELYHFNALCARMKYIVRWGLMRSSRAESLSEHTADTAILAHTLALISRNVFGTDADAGRVATAALYHDAGEILTGDMPTPVKYKNRDLKTAYKSVEREAAKSLAALAPPELRADMEACLTGAALTEKERQLLKAADPLSRIIKCIEEEHAGNREFTGAKAQQSEALAAMDCPEAEYFTRHMLPCYSMTLDELSLGW